MPAPRYRTIEMICPTCSRGDLQSVGGQWVECTHCNYNTTLAEAVKLRRHKAFLLRTIAVIWLALVGLIVASAMTRALPSILSGLASLYAEWPSPMSVVVLAALAVMPTLCALDILRNGGFRNLRRQLRERWFK
jgi:uncharacterized paraquat-inducible protein A